MTVMSKDSYGMWVGFVAVIIAIFMMAWVIRGDIATNATAIAELRGAVNANNTAIAELRGAMNANTAAIAELRGVVSANNTAIAELQGVILTHIAGHQHGGIADVSPEKSG